MRKISADIIFTCDQKPIPNGVIIVGENNEIIEILPNKNEVSEVEEYKGFLTPGFVNAHCHLELSYLKGVCNPGNKLLSFLSDVVKSREADSDKIQSAIIEADNEMRSGGIVLVGDICNTTNTAQIKQESTILYHSFFEMYDFFKEQNLEKFFYDKSELFKILPYPKSYVPHAPYTVSPDLLNTISQMNGENPISIHMQESLEEDLLFKQAGGQFVHFYKKFGIPLPNYLPTFKSSLQFTSQYFNKVNTTCFVHNTYTAKDDVAFAEEHFEQVFWVTCPNANMYIEETLPNYRNFSKRNQNMAIGTDSLASNWSLSIFDELKTILKNNPDFEFEDLIRWATINGANALKQGTKFGTLTPGKRPGLNWIKNVDTEKIKIKRDSSIEPLI